MNKKILISAISIITSFIIIFVIFFSIPSNYKSKIKVNEHQLNAFNTKTNVVKVVVFSDLHLFYDYNVNDMDLLIKKINEQKPDIIIFNGDLFDSKSYKKNVKTNNLIVSKLQQLRPLLGKFALMGDQDYLVKDTKSLLIDSDFEIINDLSRNIYVNNYNFNIIGLSDKQTSLSNLNKTSDNQFNMAFLHNPTYLMMYQDFKIDALITSHTLGGQYNLPIYGSIFKNIKDIPYYKGYNKINNIPVYNNNGIGIYNSSMRFRAPATIEVFNLF